MIQEIFTYTTVSTAFVFAVIKLIRLFFNSDKQQCSGNCCGCKARGLSKKNIESFQKNKKDVATMLDR